MVTNYSLVHGKGLNRKMVQRANGSLHVAQRLSQNFVPKPTYLLELNLPRILEKNIWRLFQVLAQFLFTTSEIELDYYHQKVYKLLTSCQTT